jgi:hypothetical protein
MAGAIGRYDTGMPNVVAKLGKVVGIPFECLYGILVCIVSKLCAILITAHQCPPMDTEPQAVLAGSTGLTL